MGGLAGGAEHGSPSTSIGATDAEPEPDAAEADAAQADAAEADAAAAAELASKEYVPKISAAAALSMWARLGCAALRRFAPAAGAAALGVAWGT
eukprot:COSAG06_NODE_19532_length_834_cov_0.948299_1_plen_93_part_10